MIGPCFAQIPMHTWRRCSESARVLDQPNGIGLLRYLLSESRRRRHKQAFNLFQRRFETMIEALSPSIDVRQDQALPLTLHSSVKEISQHLVAERRLFDWDYIKDIHFERHFLPRFLHSREDVENLLRSLDEDRAAFNDHDECHKAQSARYWRKVLNPLSEPSVASSIWALARARRVNCSCHEVGSYAKVLRAWSAQ